MATDPPNVYLGELEQTVLWSVLRLEGDAYGARILLELEKRASRKVTPGALYATLDRLEEKGLVSATLADPEPGRGGRRKRYMSLTPAGRVALQKARRTWTELWDGLEGALKGS